MALRNQPYFPLYVQDYLTDEKLNECSASAQGVYIKILCLLHKQSEYGKILLKQKDKQMVKQNESKVLNFAYKIAKNLTFEISEIENALTELIEEGVLIIEGDYLYQKRMVKDNYLSEVRSKAGKKGGNKNKFANDFAQAKSEAKQQANSEYEYEVEYEVENELKNDQIFKESICINNQIKSFDYDIILKKWLNEQKLKDDLNRSLKDIKSHFINFIRNKENRALYLNADSDKLENGKFKAITFN